MSRTRTVVVALLLLAPYAALVAPSLYARSQPSVLGFPFFYWYQFAWVILTSLLLLAVHRQLSRH